MSEERATPDALADEILELRVKFDPYGTRRRHWDIPANGLAAGAHRSLSGYTAPAPADEP